MKDDIINKYLCLKVKKKKKENSENCPFFSYPLPFLNLNLYMGKMAKAPHNRK